MRKLFLLLILILLPSVVWGATEYWISPSGDDANNGLSVGAPFKTFQYSFNTMSGGDTLWLADGTYSTTTATGYIASNDYPNVVTNSSQPPSGLDINNMTTVKAINEGSVTIDGAFFLGRSAYKRSYIKIQGITFDGGGQFFNTSYNTLKNCGFHSNNRDGAFTIGTNDHEQGNSYNLVEDCWFWAVNDRVICGNYRADKNVWRRIIIRSDGDSGSYGPSVGFTVYDSSACSVQNMIIVDRILGAGDAYADFATAQHTAGNHFNMNNEWLGCISLKSPDAGFAFEADYVGENTYKILDSIAWDSADMGFTCGGTAQSPILQNITSGETGNSGIRFYSSGNPIINETLKNIISYNAGNYGVVCGVAPTYADVYGAVTAAYYFSPCTTGAKTTNPTADGTPASLKYIMRIEDGSALKGTADSGADYGANVVYKYGTDGTRYGDSGYDTLTANSLWPYPNEDRIKTEMAADSARGFCTGNSISGNPQTLTKYIWEYLGNQIPADIYGDTEITNKQLKSGTFYGGLF